MTGAWPVSELSAALAARGTVGQRAAYLFANSPYATAYVESFGFAASRPAFLKRSLL